MLNLTNQLVEQIPLNLFSSDIYKRSNNLFKSLKPLTNYIQELSRQPDIDPIAANQSTQLLFYSSVIKASFKDILPLINKFIFNTNNIFDIRKMFFKLNRQLTMTIDRSVDIKQKFSAAVEYLQSIEAYPNTQLIKLNENKFTGQFICSVLLVHIDLHNQFYVKSKFECESFSFELEPETFKYLYEIIIEASSDTNLEYITNVLFKIIYNTFTIFIIDANLDNFHEFLNENDLEKWFTLIYKLAFDDKSDERKKEASRALVYLIEKQTSFGKMLTSIHKHIIENQHPISIDLLLNKLNQQVFIYKWIQILCDNQHTQDKTLAYTVLHSFIDIIFKSQVNPLLQSLIMFQELLLVYLNNQSIDISDELELSPLSILAIEYTTHVIKSCLEQDIQSILFEPLLLGLCTLTESKFNFAIIQPIFGCLMPLFAKNLNVDNLYI